VRYRTWEMTSEKLQRLQAWCATQVSTVDMSLNNALNSQHFWLFNTFLHLALYWRYWYQEMRNSDLYRKAPYAIGQSTLRITLYAREE
jgi:hypothetical protein